MKEIAKILLDLKAVSLSPKAPYTWASGIKSPIYCDNRLTLSFPKERKIIEEELKKLIEEKFPEVEYLMGTATAGIPHAAIVADKMNLPMGFVRSSNKDHGKGNKIEGKIVEGSKVVVIEDLFSTGGSSIKAANALKEAGFEVLGVCGIFSYNLDECKKNFENNKLPFYSLTNYDELLDIALQIDYIEHDDLEKLRAWKKDIKDESWINL